MRRRRLLKLGVFLLLGAAVNVAVAWGFALYAPFWPFSTIENGIHCETSVWDQVEIEWWKAHYPFDPMATPIRPPSESPNVDRDPSVRVNSVARDYNIECRAIGIKTISTSGTIEGVGACAADVVRLKCGWPLQSMTAARWWLRRSQPTVSKVVQGGCEIPTSHSPRTEEQEAWDFLIDGRLWPFAPLWPGFAVNTIFYAGVCWLLFAAPFAVRRRRRIKRGLCPACAYPVGTSDLCTECGKPVVPRSVEPLA